jgi:hypothetical protein
MLGTANSFPLQSQRVSHRQQAARGHGRGGYDWIYPSDRSQRYSQQVVPKSPGEVVMNDATRTPLELHEPVDEHQIAAHQHQIGSVPGNIGSARDGDAQISLCQRAHRER